MARSVVAAARAVAVASLPGVPVSQHVTSAPPRFVRLSRAGGPRDRYIDRALILVECYASTSAGAPDGQQAEADATALLDAFDLAANGGPWAGSWVSDWEPGGLVDYENPEYPKHSRFQFTGTLFVLRI